MGWQFRKSKKIGPLRITASKGGIGMSAGAGPIRAGIGADGRTRRTLRIPGTGLYHTKVVGDVSRSPNPLPKTQSPVMPESRGEALSALERWLASSAVPGMPSETDGGEFRLLGLSLESGLRILEPFWEDYEAKVRPVTLLRLKQNEAPADGLARSQAVLSTIAGFDDGFNTATVMQALRADDNVPARVMDVAAWFLRTYAALLDWAAALRAVLPPESYRTYYEAIELYPDQPLRQMREFVREYRSKLDEALKLIAEDPESDDVVTMCFAPDIDISDDAMAAIEQVRAELEAQTERLEQLGRWF